MEQFNIVPPTMQEDKEVVVEVYAEGRHEPILLNKVRQKFEIFGAISLIFGVFFALCFYRTWIGINVLMFSLCTIILLTITMKSLSQTIKIGTKVYDAGVILLGISIFNTSNSTLQFLDVAGIFLLLDLSILHQFYEDHQWSFIKHAKSMFALPIYSLASIGFPFIESYNLFKNKKIVKNDVLRNVMVGAFISLPMLLLSTVLLSHADLLFGRLTNSILSEVLFGNIFGVIVMILIGFIVFYCVLCGGLYREECIEEKVVHKADAIIAITFMTLLCMIYTVFCGIQFIYLFSNGFFALPEGVTFAEYARNGFFELLAVTAINIVIMLLCGIRFKESKGLKRLVTFMTVCTYIMIVSATYRMYLYIMAYHLTFLRLFVLLTLLIDSFILAGVILFVYNKKFPLFRYCVAVISVCYIGFSFSKPDYYIASYLVAQKETLGVEDIRYLTWNLSLDAAPVVLEVLKDTNHWNLVEQKENVGNYDLKLTKKDTLEWFQDCKKDYYSRIVAVEKDAGIRNFNFSKDIAIKKYQK
ncbi:MAG: DUF4153 domain-containing protein [Velocimicrobium sp.]